jgi:hypothetical protein
MRNIFWKYLFEISFLVEDHANNNPCWQLPYTQIILRNIKFQHFGWSYADSVPRVVPSVPCGRSFDSLLFIVLYIQLRLAYVLP